MARMRFDVPAFIAAYNEAVIAGLNLDEIADLLGLTPACVSQRVQRLTKRGIPLPKRKHGLVGTKRVKAVAVRRQDSVPAMNTGDVRIVPAQVGFTIIVGG